MIVVAIYEHAGEQKFAVHKGPEALDVTEQYEVRQLNIQDGVEVVQGWHIGKREARKEGAEL